MTFESPFEIAETCHSAQVDNLDGLTVDGAGWWFNVRREPGSETLLQLNLEANTTELLSHKLAELADLLGEEIN